MKHFVKQLTIGAVLGLAVMVSGVGQAHALLLGQDIRTTIEFPTIGNVVAGPVDSTVVDPGVEIVGFGGGGAVNIDFSDTLIKLTINASFQFQPGTFNGVRFVDINNTIPNWVASVNTGMTTNSLLGGFVLTHTDNDIFLNVQGLSVNANDTIALNVSAKPVPEPSTMLLLGTGLAGVVAWRYRKAQA